MLQAMLRQDIRLGIIELLWLLYTTLKFWLQQKKSGVILCCIEQKQKDLEKQKFWNQSVWTGTHIQRYNSHTQATQCVLLKQLCVLSEEHVHWLFVDKKHRQQNTLWSNLPKEENPSSQPSRVHIVSLNLTGEEILGLTGAIRCYTKIRECVINK